MFQYYEMSYGLNVEMHKQVRFSLFILLLLRIAPHFDFERNAKILER